MAEQEATPERPIDPELQAMIEQFGTLASDLGFVETDPVKEARAALLQGVRPGCFDRDNPFHGDLYTTFQIEAEASIIEKPTPLGAIGYQVSLAQLWLELDDPDRFYDCVYGGEGAGEMLYRTPGSDESRQRLVSLVQSLEMLRGANPSEE